MNTLETPHDIPATFADAWNARDASALAGMFAEDADFVNVVGLWWHNRADIEQAHDYGLRTFFKDSTLSIRRTKVRFVGDAIAVVHVRWRLTGQLDKHDLPLDERATIMIFVAHKSVDGWSVVAAQNTDVIPGAETYSAKGSSLEAVDYRG